MSSRMSSNNFDGREVLKKEQTSVNINVAN